MIGKKRSILISKSNIHDVISSFLYSIRAVESNEVIDSIKYIRPKFETGQYIITVKEI